MATLDRWRHFLATPTTLPLIRMELLAKDREPSIVDNGIGELRFPDSETFEYEFVGRPDDVGYLLRQINRQRDDRYDGLLRFRLVGRDETATEFSAGWTVPKISQNDNGTWRFIGSLDGGLWISDGCAKSERGSTELLFLIPANHIASIYLSRFVRTVDPDGNSVPERWIDVLDARIRFTYDPAAGILSIIANASAELPLTLVENWISEPLRILFGELVFPRLVARNLPDGSSHVSVRPSPTYDSRATWAALWHGEEAMRDVDGFWSLYTQLLSHIARGRDTSGNPNFEPNKITSLYVEVIQAAKSTRWVWAMTFASCIEGLTQMLIPRGTRRSDSDRSEIESLCRHIGAWDGDPRLKQIAVSAVHRTAEMTTKRTLEGLLASRKIGAEEFDAWNGLRNAVMHGSLVSPYSSAEDDNRLVALASLMHRLTREIMHRGQPI